MATLHRRSEGLSAIDGPAAEELTRPREAYFGTIGANLRHILITQRIWLARCAPAVHDGGDGYGT